MWHMPPDRKRDKVTRIVTTVVTAVVTTSSIIAAMAAMEGAVVAVLVVPRVLVSPERVPVMGVPVRVDMGAVEEVMGVGRVMVMSVAVAARVANLR